MIFLSDADVAALDADGRRQRVLDLIDYAHAVLDQAIAVHVNGEGKRLAGVALLFSGGNDSTVLAHLFRERATHAIHANTGIGIEQTRVFVRETCAAWDIPLIEKHPPTSYRDLVIEQGFPGPAHHFKMYQRLKERALRQARADLVRSPRHERVVFLAGRRRSESTRRAQVPEMEREGSTVWVSPLAAWTALDLATYRQLKGDVPLNEVSALIHMSGECLCGAFAEKGELEEVGYWFPDVRSEIESLEQDVVAAGNAAPYRCRWGWGADKGVIEKLVREGHDPDKIAAQFTRSAAGRLCTTCADRGEAA